MRIAVTGADGQEHVVEFASMPSDADIDEVAHSFNPVPKTVSGAGTVDLRGLAVPSRPHAAAPRPAARPRPSFNGDPYGEPGAGVTEVFKGDRTVPASQLGRPKPKAKSLLPTDFDPGGDDSASREVRPPAQRMREATASYHARHDDPFVALGLPFTAEEFNRANNAGTVVRRLDGKPMELGAAVALVQKAKHVNGVAMTRTQSQVEQDQANAQGIGAAVGKGVGFNRGQSDRAVPRGGAAKDLYHDTHYDGLHEITPSERVRGAVNDYTEGLSKSLQSAGVPEAVAGLVAGIPTFPLHIGAEIGTIGDQRESAANRLGAATNLLAYAATEAGGKLLGEATAPLRAKAVAILKNSPAWSAIVGSGSRDEAVYAAAKALHVEPEKVGAVVDEAANQGHVKWKPDPGANGPTRKPKAAEATPEPTAPSYERKESAPGIGDPRAKPAAAPVEAPAPAAPKPEAESGNRYDPKPAPKIANDYDANGKPFFNPERDRPSGKRETPKPNVEPKPVDEGQAANTPPKEPVVAKEGDPNLTGGKNATVEAERAERGSSSVQKQDYTTPQQAHEAGKAAVEAGADHETLAREVATTPRPVTTTEHGVLLEGRRKLIEEYKAKSAALDDAILGGKPQEAAKAAFDDVAERLDRNDQALVKSGRETSASLNARKGMTTLDEGDYAEVQQAARREKGGKLDAKTDAQLKAQTAQIEAGNKRIAELEADAAKGEANRTFQTSRPKTKRTVEAIRADRAAAVSVFKTKTVGAEAEALAEEGITLHNSGLRLLTEDQAKAIVTIAKTYGEEGALKLEEAVAKVRAHVKAEAGFDLSEEDVTNALRGIYQRDPKEPKTRTAGEQQLLAWRSELKERAGALAKAKAEASKSEEAEAARLVREALAAERKALAEEARGRAKAAREGTAQARKDRRQAVVDAVKEGDAQTRQADAAARKAEGEDARAQAQEARARAEAAKKGEAEARKAKREDVRAAVAEDAKATREAARRVLREEGEKRAQALRDLNARAREEAAKAAKERRAEYERLFGERNRLDASTERLKARLESGDLSTKAKPPRNPELERAYFENDKLKKQVRQTIAAQKPRTLTEKALTVARDVGNIPRALKTTFDLSAPLRQGLVLSAANPKIAARAFVEQLRAFKSGAYAHAANKAILEGENAPLYKRAGLYLSDPESGVIGEHEEAFLSNFVGKIPGVAGSERAYTTYLNTLRAGVFDKMSGGKNLSKEDLEAIAHFVNIATGRGTLGKFEKASTGLASVLFSPRYLTSRFQLPFTPLKAGASPKVRLAITKQLAQYAGTVFAFVKFAESQGAQVTWDPTSSDFMKVRLGNTRIDCLGGMQQAIVFSNRIAQGRTVSTTGKESDLGKPGFGGRTRLNVAEDFARSKLSPTPGYIATWLNGGKDGVGNNLDAADTAKDFFTPLIANDFYESIQAQGVPKGIALGIASGLGLSVSTQSPKGEEPPQLFDYLASKVSR